MIETFLTQIPTVADLDAMPEGSVYRVAFRQYVKRDGLWVAGPNYPGKLSGMLIQEIWPERTKDLWALGR